MPAPSERNRRSGTLSVIEGGPSPCLGPPGVSGPFPGVPTICATAGSAKNANSRRDNLAVWLYIDIPWSARARPVLERLEGDASALQLRAEPQDPAHRDFRLRNASFAISHLEQQTSYSTLVKRACRIVQKPAAIRTAPTPNAGRNTRRESADKSSLTVAHPDVFISHPKPPSSHQRQRDNDQPRRQCEAVPHRVRP